MTSAEELLNSSVFHSQVQIYITHGEIKFCRYILSRQSIWCCKSSEGFHSSKHPSNPPKLNTDRLPAVRNAS